MVPDPLFQRYSQLLCVYPALLVLAGHTDDRITLRERTNKMPESVFGENAGYGLAVDHDDCACIRSSLDLHNSTVLHNACDVERG